MGKCDFCKAVLDAAVECGLTHGHFKLCKTCYLKQRAKDMRGRPIRWECTSFEEVWCFFCHLPTGPDEKLFGRYVCNECMTQALHTPWHSLPKVSAEWVDPEPLASLPNGPPGVVRMNATLKNMGDSVASTMAAETIAGMMDQGGRRRRSKADNRNFRKQFKNRK